MDHLYSSITILTIICLYSANTNPVLCSCYKTIFSFGDSISDTGNTIALGLKPIVAQNPYGMTYFYAPNGRYCDGRIIIDFIAASQGLDFLPPYVGAKKCGISTVQGVSFAVAGATVLNISFYYERNVTEPDDAAYSLKVQLGWFKEHLSSVCNSTTDENTLGRTQKYTMRILSRYHDLNPGLTILPPFARSKVILWDYLSTSLIILGEFGGDDYIHPLQSGKTLEETQTYVPLVVKGLLRAVQKLISLGGKTILVPGIFPLGCSLELLTSFEGEDKEAYDPRTGCLIKIDQLAQYHNKLLQKELNIVRTLYPNVTISYVNYYKAGLPLYLYPQRYGFKKNALYSCCGGGSKYNFNFSDLCGPKVSFLCKDPSQYVSWDGRHASEKAYSYIAKAILSGKILNPPIDLSCSTSPHISKNSDFDLLYQL